MFISSGHIAEKIKENFPEVDPIYLRKATKDALLQKWMKDFLAIQCKADTIFIRPGKALNRQLTAFYNWNILIPPSKPPTSAVGVIPDAKQHCQVLLKIVEEEMNLYQQEVKQKTEKGTLLSFSLNEQQDRVTLCFANVSLPKTEEGENVLVYSSSSEEKWECEFVGTMVDEEDDELRCVLRSKNQNNIEWQLNQSYTIQTKLDIKR